MTPTPTDAPRETQVLAIGPNPDGPDHQAALAQQSDAAAHDRLAARLAPDPVAAPAAAPATPEA